MKRGSLAFPALTLVTAISFLVLISYIFWVTPEAQAAAGGLAQKIFYFHVPAAYALYLAAACCFVGSGAYLIKPTLVRDAWARAGSETAVAFGALVLVSGPLWAKKAWGVYWTWDPRLTTLLLTVLIYLAISVMRQFGGSGEAEKRFAAALGVLGTVLLPIVHYATRLWGGNHPQVITGKGDGIADSSMTNALSLGFLAMTFLAITLLWLRARMNLARSRVDLIEERLAVELD
jgi:heme exporter protein C